MMDDASQRADDPPAGDPSNDAEALFEVLLEQYDAASSEGQTPQTLDDTRLPSELRDELASLGRCVALLNRAARQGGLAAFHNFDSIARERSAAGNDGEDRSLVGETIGRFEIIRELGRGGYGLVFLAHDAAMSRDVALKLPRPEALVTPELRRRFVREAHAAGRLDHPHVLPVYEVGEDGALCYLVSPYCRGPSLAAWLAGHRDAVDTRDAAQLVASLAEGLEQAHRMGVLHRDIKPANVLLDLSATEQPKSDAQTLARPLASFVPKLTDFGLAKLLEATDNDTRTGALLGTPAYMAPEQAEGRIDRIGPATDIYSLGAVLYELLVRTPPLVGETDAETLRLIASVEPPRPRHKRRGLARDIEAVCLKCLEKSPQERYETAGDLAADLGRFLSGEPTVARRVGMGRRIWKLARRRPAVAGLLAVAAIMLASMAAGAWWYSKRLAREEAFSLEHQYARDMRAAFQAREQGAPHQTAAILARYQDGAAGAMLRGFEWHWLRKALHEEKLIIPSGHHEAYAIAFSLDGSLVFSGGQDGVIRAWDSTRGNLAFELHGHTSCVNQLAFSPHDGKLASASCDQTVRLWDHVAQRALGTVGEHTAVVQSVSFAHRMPWLASCTNDGFVRVWNTNDGSLIRELEVGPKRAIDAVLFRGDDKVLATTEGEGSCRLWKTTNWSLMATATHQALAMLFIDGGRHLAVGSKSHEILEWNPPRPDELRVLDRLPGEVRCLAAPRSETVVFAAGFDGSIRAVGLHARAHRILSGGTARVSCLAVSPDDQLLAAASFDGTLRVWNLDGDWTALADGGPAIPAAAQLSADGRTIATLYETGEARIWNAKSGALLGQSNLGSGALLFSASGKLCMSFAADDKQLCVRQVPTLEVAREFNVSRTILAASISGNDQVIALLDDDGHVIVYDIASGRERIRLPLPEHIEPDAAELALSPDGSRLSWADHGRIGPFAINTLSGRRIAAPADRAAFAFTDPRRAWSFSPDGRLSLFLENDRGTVVVCDTASGDVRYRLVHSAVLTGNCTWSPDGQRCAIATADQTIVIFASDSGDELGELDGGPDQIRSNLVFAPDGESLMAFTVGTGHPGRLHTWKAPRE